jgi:hypothetical protein
MTDITATIKTLFEADNGAGGMATLLTGGIYTRRGLKRKGISRTTTPIAYDGAGLLKPLVVITQRGQIPTYDMADRDGQFVTTRQVLELWFENDDEYTPLEQARERAYVLLHEQRIAGVGRLTLVNRIDDSRDASLNDAALLRDDYQIDSYKQVEE